MKWRRKRFHIQIPAVDWPSDRIRKPQSCELTAADSPLSTTVCKWMCSALWVMWFTCVLTYRTPPIRQIQLLIFEYFVKVKRRRKGGTEVHSRRNKRKIGTYWQEKEQDDKGAHQHFWDCSEFWSDSGEVKHYYISFNFFSA